MREILRCENLYFAYEGMQHNALENVNFSVYENDFLAVIGPNGGGKSTLVKLLIGLLAPYSGEIIYPNPSLHHAKSLIGYVPQDTNANMDFPINVLDVVLMGFMELRLLGFRATKAQRRKAMELLEQFEVAHLAHNAIAELSGGQRQRVLIARALCGDPKLLVLDEPTSNIDTKMQRQIYKSLKKINNFHTIILISHHISVLLGYANRALFVDKEVIEHMIPSMQHTIDADEHICEVDLFDKLCAKSKEK